MIYGIDFGTGSALAVHGPSGPISKRAIKLPRVPGGRTPAMEFPLVVEALFIGSDDVPGGDVVVESPTLGSSGCERRHIVDLLARHPDRALFTVSARAVKNFRKDHDLGWKKGARYVRDGDPAPAEMTLEEQASVHVEEAEIIYRIATEYPDRLYRWTGPSLEIERQFTSVRPMDKHLYRPEHSPDAARFLALLPPFETLPGELRAVLGIYEGTGKNKRLGYSRSMVMPFAMATQEPHVDDGPIEDRRKRYEKVIGLYDRGYPSFYRRATVDWMHVVAKGLAEATKIEEVTREQRKLAWKTTQRQIRWFFHLMMAHQGR